MRINMRITLRNRNEDGDEDDDALCKPNQKITKASFMPFVYVSGRQRKICHRWATNTDITYFATI